MRALVARTAFLFCFQLVVLLPAVRAEAGDAWRAVPRVPELALRFDPADGAAPCAALPANVAPDVVECWSAYVDRAAGRRSSPLTAETNLACVEHWEVTPAGQGGCPGDAARCVRPAVGPFERMPADLPIDSNVSAAWAMAADLAREYTAFQALRSGHALNPHRPRIAGLALSEGMLVLYRAEAIAALGRQLAASGCARDHLEPYLELAAHVTREIGSSDVPRILEGYPPAGREWARRFYRVQLAVLASPTAPRPGGGWQQDCEKAASLGSDVGRLDADVNVWCGVAYERLDMPGVASLHWRLARRSPNHPEAASYASERLSLEPEASAETAEVRP